MFIVLLLILVSAPAAAGLIYACSGWRSLASFYLWLALLLGSCLTFAACQSEVAVLPDKHHCQWSVTASWTLTWQTSVWHLTLLTFGQMLACASLWVPKPAQTTGRWLQIQGLFALTLCFLLLGCELNLGFLMGLSFLSFLECTGQTRTVGWRWFGMVVADSLLWSACLLTMPNISWKLMETPIQPQLGLWVAGLIIRLLFWPIRFQDSLPGYRLQQLFLTPLFVILALSKGLPTSDGISRSHLLGLTLVSCSGLVALLCQLRHFWVIPRSNLPAEWMNWGPNLLATYLWGMQSGCQRLLDRIGQRWELCCQQMMWNLVSGSPMGQFLVAAAALMLLVTLANDLQREVTDAQTNYEVASELSNTTTR